MKLKSYTLVELMVVVVIITIIAGIAIPLYTQSTQETKDRLARNALKVVFTGLMSYRLEHGHFLKLADADSNGVADNPALWQDLRLDDPSAVQASLGYGFWVDSPENFSVTNFTAYATRFKDNKRYSVDETGTLTGETGLPTD